MLYLSFIARCLWLVLVVLCSGLTFRGTKRVALEILLIIILLLFQQYEQDLYTVDITCRRQLVSVKSELHICKPLFCLFCYSVDTYSGLSAMLCLLLECEMHFEYYSEKLKPALKYVVVLSLLLMTDSVVAVVVVLFWGGVQSVCGLAQ